MGKVALIVIAILVVAGAGFWYWTNKSSFMPQPTLKPPVNVTEVSPSPNTQVNMIKASDQSDGDVLSVDSVTNAKPVFVVLHKATKEGTPGTVVGVSDLLSEGTHDSLDIDISPIAKKGDIYFAMLHEDSNGNKKYDGETTDMPIKDESGQMVMAKFTITITEAPPAAETSTEEE
jgi:hypothetical protein